MPEWEVLDEGEDHIFKDLVPCDLDNPMTNLIGGEYFWGQLFLSTTNASWWENGQAFKRDSPAITKSTLQCIIE